MLPAVRAPIVRLVRAGAIVQGDTGYGGSYAGAAYIFFLSPDGTAKDVTYELLHASSSCPLPRRTYSWRQDPCAFFVGGACRVVASTVSSFSSGFSFGENAFFDMEHFSESVLEVSTSGSRLIVVQGDARSDLFTMLIAVTPCDPGEYALASNATCVLWYVQQEDGLVGPVYLSSSGKH